MTHPNVRLLIAAFFCLLGLAPVSSSADAVTIIDSVKHRYESTTLISACRRLSGYHSPTYSATCCELVQNCNGQAVETTDRSCKALTKICSTSASNTLKVRRSEATLGRQLVSKAASFTRQDASLETKQARVQSALDKMRGDRDHQNRLCNVSLHLYWKACQRRGILDRSIGISVRAMQSTLVNVLF